MQRMMPRLFAALWLVMMALALPAFAQTLTTSSTTTIITKTTANSGTSVVLKGPIFSTPSAKPVAAALKTQVIEAQAAPAAPATGAPADATGSAFKVDQDFNHQNTRFPLEGMHVKVTCETCHKGGIFKGTPTACASCHNGDMAKGKNLEHPKTSIACADCHNQFDFSQVHVDHSQIQNGCISCHDNVVAVGKDRKHIKSSKNCEDCHVTTTWRVARFNHENTAERCETCHDNLHATGKPATHIRSTNDCAQCHRTVDWKIGVFDHTGVVDGCVKCHDGIQATGKSIAHLDTSDECQTCHTTVAWRPSNFKHDDPKVAALVKAGNCIACHDGRRATGRSSTHFLVNTNDCQTCHTTTVAWKPALWDHKLAADETNCVSCHNGQRLPAQGKAQSPTPHVVSGNDCVTCHTGATNYVTWAGAKMDHTGITTGCVTCHNNKLQVGGKTVQGKTPTHMATTDFCESCHVIGVTWAPAIMPMNHAQVTGTCVSCHDGSKTLSTGQIVLGKAQAPNGHLLTSDKCDVCHSTTLFKPALKFDHSEVKPGTACATCHNGSAATGMLTGPNHMHIPVNGGANANCSDCHRDFKTWAPAVMDHSKVSTNCVDCHNGTTATGKGILKFKPVGHIPVPASQNCADCHTSFTTWQTKMFDHSGIGSTPCASCHDGVKATGKDLNRPHMPTPPGVDCKDCHVTTQWSPVVFDAAKHGLVSSVCADCHNGSTTISTGKLTSKPTPHIDIGSANCSDCHKSFTTWVTTFTHDATSMGGKTCAQCHDGVSAKGKKNAAIAHIPSSDTCDDCHKNFTAFSPAPFGATEHGLVSNTCTTCHNGTQAISVGKLVSKPAVHITFPAGQNCGDCHKSFTTWVTTFDHATAASTPCLSCHDGKLAKGKLPTHVPASNLCQNCHTTTVWLPVVLPFNHADPGVVGQACEKCHDNVNATGRGTNHILTSTGACASCHSGTTAWTQIASAFHNFVTGTCFSCHDGAHSTVSKPISGKGNTHLATSDLCVNCHVANITSWKPAKMPFDHTQSKGTCLSCHNGTKTISSGLVKPKSTNHVQSSDECALCHTTVTFKPAVFSHSDTKVATLPCLTCHNGSVPNAFSKANAPAPGHPATSDLCADCHSTTSFKVVTFDHLDPVVAAAKCSSCHDTGKPQAVVRPVGHPSFNAATQDCSDCHKTFTTWVTNAKPDHSSFVGNCVTCHNNAPTIGKNAATHLVTDDSCDSCHTTIAFAPATFDHGHSSAVTSCNNCHDGAHKISTGTITGKSSFPAHPNTSTACELCHSGYTSWVTTKFDHSDPVVSKATCVSCHDGAHAPAMAKSLTHIATSTSCNLCHNTTNKGFKPAVVVDHTQVTGTCYSCHNGSKSISTGLIMGKGPTHFATTNTCESCHNTTNKGFVPKIAVDHTQVTGTCLSCHDNAHTISTGPVRGKTGNHINSTNACVNCHTTTNFKPGIQPRQTDHTQVIGTCFSCHDGSKSISTGAIVGKGPTHLPTANTCESCHSTTSFVPALAFDHTGVKVGTCVTCHNNVQAVGKTPSHMQTNNVCDDCHVNFKTWKPVAPSAFKHTSTIGTCYSCHNGTMTISTGKVTPKSANHIASSTACDTCHKTTANWNVTAVQVDHTQVTGSCSTCHGGSSKLSLTGGTISHKSTSHLNTSNNCDVCHKAGGAPWTPAIAFDHTAAIGTCYSCHDGAHSTSLGKVTPKDAAHLNTTNSCESCHVTGTVFANWKVTPLTKFDHSQAIGTCMSCHDGTHKLGITGTIVTPKNTGHFITTKDCALCHTTTAFKPALTYTHISAAYVLHYFGTTSATCITCHKQNNEKITYAQPSLFPNCAVCHSVDFKPSSHKKYTSPTTAFYTFVELKDCSGACHTYSDQTLTKITTSNPGPHHRASKQGW